jgi:hypothetical protein
VSRSQLEEDRSAPFRDRFEGLADSPLRFRLVRPTGSELLLYPLLGEPGLGLRRLAVNVGQGRPGDVVAFSRRTPVAIVAPVGALLTCLGNYRSPLLTRVTNCDC